MENLFSTVFQLLKVNQLVSVLSRSHQLEGYEEVFKLLLHHVHKFTPHFEYKENDTYSFEPCRMDSELKKTNPIVSKLFELLTFDELKQLAQTAGRAYIHNLINLDVFSLVSLYTLGRQAFEIKQLKQDSSIKELKMLNEMIAIKEEQNMELVP